MIYRTVRRFVGTALAATMAFACFVASQPVAASAASVDVSKYDGRTVFEGIYMGRGPVARALPEVWGKGDILATLDHKDPQLRAQVDRGVTNFMDRMAASDPGFFADFKRDVTSGDPVAVNAALDRTYNDVTAIMKKDRSAKTLAVLADTGSYKYTQTYLAAYFTIAVVVYGVAVLVVVIPDQPQPLLACRDATRDKVAQKNCEELRSAAIAMLKDHTSHLERDQLVVTITQRFARA